MPTPAQIADALLHADHALSGESMMAVRHLQTLAAAYRALLPEPIVPQWCPYCHEPHGVQTVLPIGVAVPVIPATK